MSSPVLSARARTAALVRHHPDHPEIAAPARRELAAAMLAEHVARVVADAPPLTTEQRDRITSALWAGSAGDRTVA